MMQLRDRTETHKKGSRENELTLDFLKPPPGTASEDARESCSERRAAGRGRGKEAAEVPDHVPLDASKLGRNEDAEVVCREIRHPLSHRRAERYRNGSSGGEYHEKVNGGRKGGGRAQAVCVRRVRASATARPQNPWPRMRRRCERSRTCIPRPPGGGDASTTSVRFGLVHLDADEPACRESPEPLRSRQRHPQATHRIRAHRAPTRIMPYMPMRPCCSQWRGSQEGNNARSKEENGMESLDALMSEDQRGKSRTARRSAREEGGQTVFLIYNSIQEKKERAREWKRREIMKKKNAETYLAAESSTRSRASIAMRPWAARRTVVISYIIYKKKGWDAHEDRPEVPKQQPQASAQNVRPRHGVLRGIGVHNGVDQRQRGNTQ
ncbi:hypothetical protein FB451DRAFT_1196745 [Mycena latifolia]|nr:hypothetical protein FB451DRAFT_1196745 [Mycena latifolia]